MQLDDKERGFSFLRDGELDMRMDRSEVVTAKDIVNKCSEQELGRMFREYGEERQWKKAARAIVETRRKKKIESTTELATILGSVLGRVKKRNPATLVFQALRAVVNREFESIEKGVKDALDLLKPGGRIGVISFHSLEDRIVKRLFRAGSKCVKGGLEEAKPIIKILTQKPLVPSFEEKNRRARSAKFRAAERQ